MSVTAKDVTFNPFTWVTDIDGNHRLVNTTSMVVRLELGEGRGRADLHVFFKAGYRCDGLSVPWMFRWFLKNWDDKNDLYNIAGALHDALYGNKGFGVFSRSESDDIFRGLLQESGKDRKHASMADWCVGVFAGGHWGDDNLGAAKDVTISMDYYND